MTLGSWIAVGVVVLLIAGGIAWAMRVDNSYVKAARAFAEKNGWTYRDGDDDLSQRFPELPSANARPRLNTQIIEGKSRGRQFLSYRYAWTQWRGKSSVSHDFVVTATELDRDVDRDDVARLTDQIAELETRAPKATWHVEGSWVYLKDKVTAHTTPEKYVEILGDIADALEK